MRSKPVDIFIIWLILLYTVLVVVYLAIDNIISESHTATLALQIFELVLLFIFVVETILNFVGFGQLFLQDCWNIADITVILLAIVLVALEMTLTDGQLSGLLKVRGVFRLLRIGILFRKFEAIRKKRAAQRRHQTRDIFHLKAPAEIVNEILMSIRDMVDNDDKLIEDINYCIKMVSSGKLYEANLDAPLGSDENVDDAINFFTNYQDKQSNNKVDAFASNPGTLKKFDTFDIDKALNLSDKSKNLLDNVNSLDFNIFEFKEENNEKGNYLFLT